MEHCRAGQRDNVRKALNVQPQNNFGLATKEYERTVEIKTYKYGGIIQWQNSWLLTSLSEFDSLCPYQILLRAPQSTVIEVKGSDWLPESFCSRIVLKVTALDC